MGVKLGRYHQCFSTTGP